MATAAATTREGKKQNNSLRDFQGVNTQAARQVIGDNQFAWLENVIPVGFGNLIAVPGPSGVLATWPGTAYHMRSVNLNGVTYEIIFTADGAIYAVNLATFAVTTVGPPDTLSGAGSEICQWENTEAIIVDPTKGYYTWDGTTPLQRWDGTIQSLTITAIGTGFTSAPTLTLTGGGGTGATATSKIQVGLASIAAGGTGYVTGDVLSIAGGTFTTAAQIKVASVAAGGVVNGINLVNTGVYTAAPTNPASVTGGYGTGATFTLNFGVGPTTVVTMGSGYTSAPTVGITGGGGTAAAITANPSVVPSGGTSVATYAGRVWVSSNRTIVFSGPNTFNDFTSTSSGGSFIMVDETLVGTITALRAANNFLYIFGDSSVNVIADVSVVNGTTVFSNTNISSSIGTSYENSIISYYRTMWFANSYGVYGLYGSTTQKASDELDGIFPLLLNVPGGVEITAGTVVIHEILCLGFLVKYNDPIAGPRALLLIFFSKKWFFCSQGNALINIDTALIAGAPALYGTDGTRLYQLLSNDLFPISQTIVTKLWDMGDPLVGKQSLKFGLEILNPVSPQTVTGTIDTELSSGSIPVDLTNTNLATWENNAGAIVSWANNLGAIVEWVASGYAMLALDIATAGRYLGVSLYASSAKTVYEGMHLQYEKRESWPQGGPQ